VLYYLGTLVPCPAAPNSAAPIVDPSPRSGSPIVVYHDPRPRSAPPIVVHHDPRPRSAPRIVVHHDPRSRSASTTDFASAATRGGGVRPQKNFVRAPCLLTIHDLRRARPSDRAVSLDSAQAQHRPFAARVAPVPPSPFEPHLSTRAPAITLASGIVLAQALVAACPTLAGPEFLQHIRHVERDAAGPFGSRYLVFFVAVAVAVFRTRARSGSGHGRIGHGHV
jgi:hypothetical protein